MRVAKNHDAGKESYAQSIACELFEDYLRVEERFAANQEATEQEVIDSMRKVGFMGMRSDRFSPIPKDILVHCCDSAWAILNDTG